MKKFFGFLIGLLISLSIAQSASATPYPVELSDQIVLYSHNGTTSAGPLNFNIKGTSDTFLTFCLQPDSVTSYGEEYTITSLEEGSGEATADPASVAWKQITWLYWNFDQGTLTQDDDDDGHWSGLQYAFWILVGDEQTSSDPDDYGALDYIALATSNISGWSNNGRVMVAVNRGQDVLVAGAPVPEPATMFLFGIGLLGLAGVSRKKLA